VRAIGRSSSKVAVISTAHHLATEKALHNINVDLPAPARSPTEMSGGPIEQFEEGMLEGIPVRRFGRPEDLKGVKAFLASRVVAYATGQPVVADGGQMA
jgi:NAD(P)-dependent dehydrogenase (short-subunit alcohol dehydrogenase family)